MCKLNDTGSPNWITLCDLTGQWSSLLQFALLTSILREYYIIRLIINNVIELCLYTVNNIMILENQFIKYIVINLMQTKATNVNSLGLLKHCPVCYFCNPRQSLALFFSALRGHGLLKNTSQGRGNI